MPVPDCQSFMLIALQAMSQHRWPKPMIRMFDYTPRWVAIGDGRSIEVTRRSRMSAGVGS